VRAFWQFEEKLKDEKKRKLTFCLSDYVTECSLPKEMKEFPQQ
jgi:hypothetical protein